MGTKSTIERNTAELPAGRTHLYPSTRKRTSRKIRPQLAMMQARRGMSNRDIAAVQGVNPSTIARFMERMKPERVALESFKSERADILAMMQASSLEVTQKIIETLKDGDLTALTPQQKTGLLLALNAQHGTTFDKERLERGQSTSNQSIVSRLIDSEVKGIYAQPRVIGSSSAPK